MALLDVIVGGVIAVAGAVSGPPIAHLLTDRKEKRKERLERLQELVALIYEHREWAGDMARAEAFCSDNVPKSTALIRARSIVEVHFPELSERLTVVTVLTGNLISWGIDRRMEQLEGRPFTQDGQFQDNYTKFVQACQAAVDAISGMAAGKAPAKEFAPLSPRPGQLPGR